VTIARAVENAVQQRRASSWETPPVVLVHYICFIYVCRRLGKYPYAPDEVADLWKSPPTVDEIREIREELEIKSVKYIQKNFAAGVAEKLLKHVGVYLNDSFLRKIAVSGVGRSSGGEKA
jgi:hypothetical protein